jgi:hypothetical protein
MSEITKLADSLSKVDIYQYILDILRLQESRDFIEDLIKGRLFLKGTDCFGKKLETDSGKLIGSFYSGFTFQRKKKKGQRASNVTLNDTGAFYDSIEAQVPFKTVNISANFGSGDEHIQKNFQTSYSSEEDFENAILGLTEEQFQILGEKIILPKLEERLNRVLNV